MTTNGNDIAKKTKDKAAAAMKLAKRNEKGVATFQGLAAEGIKDIMNQYLPMIANVLPKHLTPEKMIQIVTTLLRQNPGLAECSQLSIIGGVLTSSMLGLDLNPTLGQAYLVPFYNKRTKQKEAQFIRGYKGIINLARRSGDLSTIYAEMVYENDEFRYELGLNPDLVHKPAVTNRGNPLYVYSVAKYTNGGYNFIVMSMEDVAKYRERSKAKDRGPWVDDYEAMVRKTAIRRLEAYLPMSVEYKTALSMENTITTPEAFLTDPGDIDMSQVTIVEEFEVQDDDTAAAEGSADIVDIGDAVKLFEKVKSSLKAKQVEDFETWSSGPEEAHTEEKLHFWMTALKAADK
jgi:recombination protein RecT